MSQAFTPLELFLILDRSKITKTCDELPTEMIKEHPVQIQAEAEESGKRSGWTYRGHVNVKCLEE